MILSDVAWVGILADRITLEHTELRAHAEEELMLYYPLFSEQ